jgi:hypothetical protein
MKSAPAILIVLLAFSFMGCEPITEKQSGQKIFQVVTVQNNTASVTNKTLGEIQNEDLTDGFFTYVDKQGRQIVTTIDAELDHMVIEAYPQTIVPENKIVTLENGEVQYRDI